MSLSEFPHYQPDQVAARRRADAIARKRRAEARAIRLERALKEAGRTIEEVGINSDRDAARFVSVHGRNNGHEKRPVVDESIALIEDSQGPEDRLDAAVEDVPVDDEIEHIIFEDPSGGETDIFAAAGIDPMASTSIHRPIFAGYEDFDKRLMSREDRIAEREYLQEAWGSYASTHE